MTDKKIEELSIEKSEEFYEKIDLFALLLLEWNKVHNLTGSITKDGVMAQVYDSVYPMSFINSWGERVLDIGSGAGFPAIPLAIAMPGVKFTLVEPSKKRVSFLNYLKIKLRLSNVEIIDKRIEECDKMIYNTITSKAVMGADMLLSLAGGMMDKESVMLLYKGRDTDSETEGIKNVKTVDAPHSRYLLIKKG